MGPFIGLVACKCFPAGIIRKFSRLPYPASYALSDSPGVIEGAPTVPHPYGTIVARILVSVRLLPEL